MKIGDLVWNHYHGILRFGTITGKEIKEDKWAYCTVKWYDDDTYEKSMAWRKKLTGIDYSLKEYRLNHLKVISKDNLKKVVEEHEEHLKENFLRRKK